MAPGKGSWEEARTLIETETGPVTSVLVLSSGRNSEISVIVHAADEATFIKGRRADHPQAWTQKREKAVNPLVRHVSPRLKWATADDEWSLLGYEPAPGSHADYRPDSPDLPKVADALRQLQDVVLPGDIEVKQAEDRWRAYTDRPELLVGPALLHTDWTPSNVLVSDRARLVDWAWPTRGAAWIDPACWTVWLIASGHAPDSAESWAARIPSWQHVPADALDEYAHIQARMWDGIDAESTEDWTATLARAARLWADHRNSHLPSGEGKPA
jgi:hypothetical protein